MAPSSNSGSTSASITTVKPRPPHGEPSIHVTLPEGNSFTMTHPTAERPGVCVTRLHPGGEAAIPAHWHETHTEFLRVVQGYMLIQVGNDTRLYGPGDAPAIVPPFTIHAPARGDTAAAKPYWAARKTPEEGWEGEDVVFEEWTTPADGQKEVFFRNGIGFYKDYFEPVLVGRLSMLKIPSLMFHITEMVHFSGKADNYMLLVPMALGRSKDGTVSWMARAATYGVLRLCGLVTWFGGRKTAWREEYTPVELRAACKAMD